MHITEQDENVEEIRNMPCPSTSACPKNWEEYNNNPLKIYNLRPPKCRGPPVTLFHPVFSQFLSDYANCELIDSDKRYVEVLKFSEIVGQIYEDKSLRQKALRPFFTSLFDGIQPISFLTDNGAIIDDVLFTDNREFGEKAIPIIWEYKNEIGTGGKDPSIQGGCGYFTETWSFQATSFRHHFNIKSISNQYRNDVAIF